MMWWSGTGFGWGWMVFGALWMIVFWGAVIALIVWVVRRLTEPRQAPPSTTPGAAPLEVLKMRYARGEITKEQFDAIRRDLEGK